MDDAERAVEVGTRLVEAVGTLSGSNPASSSHVNAVADALRICCRVREGTAGEAVEEEQSDSDVEMESHEERVQRKMNSEMCEVSDSQEWMLYHHGCSDYDSLSQS